MYVCRRKPVVKVAQQRSDMEIPKVVLTRLPLRIAKARNVDWREAYSLEIVDKMMNLVVLSEACRGIDSESDDCFGVFSPVHRSQ